MCLVRRLHSGNLAHMLVCSGNAVFMFVEGGGSVNHNPHTPPNVAIEPPRVSGRPGRTQTRAIGLRGEVSIAAFWGMGVNLGS